jgi:CHASE2 domain-containing sensor protein
MLMFVFAVISFVCLVVSLLAFRRFHPVLAWTTLAGFIIFLVMTLVWMWHTTNT